MVTSDKTPALTLCLFKEGVPMETSLWKGVSMKKRIHPWFVTGIVEGEGCFSVSFNRRKRISVGIETRPSFSISLSKQNLKLLKELREYFGCGAIRFSRSDRTYKYETRSVEDIAKKIIPHFERFPLQGDKRKDFEKFQKIVGMVRANLHLNQKKLREIISVAYEMNPSGKRRYKKEDLLRVLSEVKV